MLIPNYLQKKAFKKPTSHLHNEGYFKNFDFDWKSIYLLPSMVTVDTNRYRKTSILWHQFQEFFSAGLDLTSILPQNAIFSFLVDALEYNFL